MCEDGPDEHLVRLVACWWARTTVESTEVRQSTWPAASASVISSASTRSSVLQPGVLTFGEVLQAVPQQTADLVERVVTVTAPAELLLLDAAADLVDDLSAELDDVEGVQHLHGVGQRVAQGVGVAAKGVERSSLICARNSGCQAPPRELCCVRRRSMHG